MAEVHISQGILHLEAHERKWVILKLMLYTALHQWIFNIAIRTKNGYSQSNCSLYLLIDVLLLLETSS